MKDYIEERAIGIDNYIIENNVTVRQRGKEFGVSKSIRTGKRNTEYEEW